MADKVEDKVDLPFHSSSASPEELAQIIYDAGKDSVKDKLGTFDNSEALVNKIIKEAARHLEHAQDKCAGEAQVWKLLSSGLAGHLQCHTLKVYVTYCLLYVWAPAYSPGRMRVGLATQAPVLLA